MALQILVSEILREGGRKGEKRERSGWRKEGEIFLSR
jgi:hypothetical protein